MLSVLITCSKHVTYTLSAQLSALLLGSYVCSQLLHLMCGIKVILTILQL